MDVYLIDGNSYLYRAFFAIKGLTDAAGRPTNAVLGFTRMVLKIIKDKKPSGLIVSFDTPHPTERHEMYSEYKAHRPGMPDDLAVQIPLVKQVLNAMNIKIVEAPGYEADDVLATLAKRASELSMDAYIVTGDKDMLQVVGGSVKVYDPSKDIVINRDWVIDKFGLPPERITELMALTGDASDNIPGVKGIGPKTASKLLQSHKLDDVQAHPEIIENAKLREMIALNLDDIKLSRALATVNPDVPLEINDEDFNMKRMDADALLRVFKELGFASMMGLVGVSEAEEPECENIEDAQGMSVFAEMLKQGFSFKTDSKGGQVKMAIYSNDGRCVCVSATGDDGGAFLEILKSIFHEPGIAKTAHNIKQEIKALKAFGIDTNGNLNDPMLASYLLNPSRQDHSLETLCAERFATGIGGNDGLSRAASIARMSMKLWDDLYPELKQSGLDVPYFQIESPLVYVLADMESRGIKIDAGLLLRISKELETELSAMENRIYFIAGGEFNINSPKQLSEVLFERLGLKPVKKKKTGFSTDMTVLEELSKAHELPAEILSYRSVSKLKNTYTDVLPGLVDRQTGRLHTNFNQTATQTGRLSSTEPNLQNIPARGPWGMRIREAFVPEAGCAMMSADYSQIELRILAHLSEDPVLTGAFSSGLDVHSMTASEIFGVSGDNVTSEMRRIAKIVNFGVIYGMSAFGLSETLGISRSQAQDYISRYFQRHTAVSAYISHAIEQAEKTGFAKTISGRIRHVPELKSRNPHTRQLGERLAVNSPIQGSAADIIAKAMIDISGEIKRSGIKTAMLLQIHDELVFESPANELEGAMETVRVLMENSFKLKIPLKVEIKTGRNWAECAK